MTNTEKRPTIADEMVRLGLVQRRGEARRLADMKAVMINGVLVSDVAQPMPHDVREIAAGRKAWTPDGTQGGRDDQ